MRNKYTEPNIACIIGLYKQGRVNMSDKHLKRLQRRLSRLQKRYTQFETKHIINDTDNDLKHNKFS